MSSGFIVRLQVYKNDTRKIKRKQSHSNDDEKGKEGDGEGRVVAFDWDG